MKITWNDEARLEITCPTCHAKFFVRFGDLRAGKSVTHDACGTVFDSSQFAEEIRHL